MDFEHVPDKAVDSACRCGNHAAPPALDDNAANVARRGFLRIAVAGTVVGAVAGAIAPPPPAEAAEESPDAAIKAMLNGNERYVSGQLKSLEEDLSILKAKTAEKQEPFAAVLSCADSRVPVEIVFDQSIGHLFVVRIAGNIVTPEIMASLEYGVAVLGAKAIMVLGHGNCGAVKAAIEGKAVPGQISALYAPIRPAVNEAMNEAGSKLDAAIDANARIQAALLSTASPIIVGAIKEQKLKVVPARYDLASGKVSLLA